MSSFLDYLEIPITNRVDTKYITFRDRGRAAVYSMRYIAAHRWTVNSALSDFMTRFQMTFGALVFTQAVHSAEPIRVHPGFDDGACAFDTRRILDDSVKAITIGPLAL